MPINFLYLINYLFLHKNYFRNVLPKVLKGEATEEKGEMARLTSFVGAMAVADLVKTTLGPKGMDKILRPSGPGP